jgi:hypothetical protein
MNHWVSSQIVARSFWFSITEQPWLKTQAMSYVSPVARFHCHQLFVSINLFAFLIVTQFRFHVEQSLPAMVGVVFTVQHLQLQLTM